MEKVIGHMGQHTGSGGTETAWIKFKPSNPPEWLNEFGGNLEEAFVIIRTQI